MIRIKVAIKEIKNPNGLIGYLQTIDYIYVDCNPTKQEKVFIVFDAMSRYCSWWQIKSYGQRIALKRQKT